MMKFKTKLYEWANKALSKTIPDQVKAFSFNLFETPVGFGIELIGAGSFDENDEDWACDEVFEPTQRQLDIPIAYSGKNWEQCLKKMKTLVLQYLNSNEPGAVILNKAQGVGIGFVDGNLELLKKP
jgi:hypothetical protein